MSSIDFSNEVTYKTARSGGKGGQNVNKVETMVEARWHIDASSCFSEEEKTRIHQTCATSINADGLLVVKSQLTRSQLENKQDALKKMKALVKKALHVAKKRKATKPTAASKAARKKDKKISSDKKEQRKKISFGSE